MMSAASIQKNQSDSRELRYLNAAALLLIMVSAFATIYSTHACRALYAQLQVLESAQWFLHDDYGRPMLEQSIWASHRRVENVAREELGMGAPALAAYKVIAQ